MTGEPASTPTVAEPTPTIGGPQPAPPVPTRRRRRRRIAVASALGVGALWWIGWHSPVTVVEHVVVDSPRGISAQAIRLASGISAADHVPSVDAEAVRQSIMSAIPAVADVAVQRSLPHTVRLEVTARTPLAAVRSGGGYLVMDAEGVIFDQVKHAKDLVVIKASSDEDRQVTRQLLASVPDTLRERITQVTTRSPLDISLRLRSGATVRWGSVEDSPLKARVLAGLMTVKATGYDVSVPLLPTTSGSTQPSTAP